MSTHAAAIDESLYSRQLYVLGHEAQKRMATSSVLLVGLNGLGVEIAKNVILAGPKSVTLYDATLTSYLDLSSQFYLSENDIGKERGRSSLEKLAELNPYVHVSLLNASNTQDLEASIRRDGYSVIVIVDAPLDVQLHLADLAHDVGSAVIVSDVRGVFGTIFCDFGDNFTVIDDNGEPPATSLVAGIIYDPVTASAVVTVLEETRHGLETGDVVTFSDIIGSIGNSLNGREFKVVVKGLFTFEISLISVLGVSDVGTYERGGNVKQVKQPVNLSFEKMSASIDKPEPFLSDVNKLYRAGISHLLFK